MQVLVDMISQNKSYSKLNMHFPFASQPVLDFMFSLDLRSFVGKESRSLQYKMLRDLDMEMVAGRRHKSSMGVMFRRHVADHEDYLMNCIETGVFNSSGLIDISAVKNIFLELKCGLPSIGLPVIVKIVDQELLIKDLGLRGTQT